MEPLPCATCKGAGWLVVDVPVSDPRFGQTVPCMACGIVAERRLAKTLAQAEIPPQFRETSLDTFPVTDGTNLAALVAGDWARQQMPAAVFALDAPSLVLAGPVGVGKTGLAIAALRQRMAAGPTAGLFLQAPALLVRIRATYATDSVTTEQALLDTLTAVPLLVLDDIGAERVTDWVREKLFLLVNHRHDWQLPTIFTTNLDRAGLGRHLGDRITSRIVEMSTWVDMTGPSLREHRS